MLGLRKRKVKLQTGRGLGSIFSSIFRKIKPIARSLYNIGKRVFSSAPVKKVVKSAQNTALQGGVQVIEDVNQGKNVAESLKTNVKQASKKIASDAAQEAKLFLEGKKSRPPRKTPAKKSKKSRKKLRPDVFT